MPKFRIHLAALEQLDRGQAQPLLFGGNRACRKATGHRAAGVGPMAGVGQPAQDAPIPPERHGKTHVHQMGAAKIGIIDDVDIARFRRYGDPGLDALDDRPGGELHHTDKHRQAFGALRDQAAIGGVIDAVGSVIRLGDDRREGGAGEGQVHLITNLLQPGLNDRQSDRVKHGAPR